MYNSDADKTGASASRPPSFQGASHVDVNARSGSSHVAAPLPDSAIGRRSASGCAAATVISVHLWLLPPLLKRS